MRTAKPHIYSRSSITDAAASKENYQMSRDHSEYVTTNIPTAIRPAVLRAGLALAVVAAMTAFALRTHVQHTVSQTESASVLTIGQ